MATFSTAQVEQLLHPINPVRVLKDGKGMSHVSQQDVLAHLTRVFGFGGFDIEVLDTTLIFEQPRIKDASEIDNRTRWDVCYRALVRLTVRNGDGEEVAHYENGSTATAQNQTRGDAHDLAYKSAISLSVKRAAIALGDGFGLSLYNKGQIAPLVIGTKVSPDGPMHWNGQKVVLDTTGKDLQEGVPQQVSLGNDETEAEGLDPQAAADRATGGAQ